MLCGRPGRAREPGFSKERRLEPQITIGLLTNASGFPLTSGPSRRPGWKFVRTARRYRTIEIQAGAHTVTAADPLPDDLHRALEQIHRPSGAH